MTEVAIPEQTINAENAPAERVNLKRIVLANAPLKSESDSVNRLVPAT